MSHSFQKPCKFIVIMLGIIILFGTVISAEAQSFHNKVEEYITMLIDRDQFSGSILVATDGKIILEKGYGPANLEHDIPNTPETIYRIGSITKQFTAVLIMQLEQDGKLKTDDSLTKHLSWYRDDIGRNITIHHLLTHTSGIPSYTGLPGWYDEHSRDYYPVKEFIEKFCSNDLEFEPGSQWKYNNSGYFILGAIIEEITGKTYEEVLQERILTPLGMKSSGYDHFGRIIKGRATGYSAEEGEIRNSNYLDMSLPYAAGALYSTVGDLYRWDRALYTESLLSDSMKKKMFTPFLNDYAYGVGVRMNNGRKTILHSGGINGFLSFLTRIVSEDACIVVLSNLTSSPVSKIAMDIEKMLFGEEYELPGKK